MRELSNKVLLGIGHPSEWKGQIECAQSFGLGKSKITWLNGEKNTPGQARPMAQQSGSFPFFLR